MDRKLPRVSVVVTTHNQARYLPEALSSVLAQDLPSDLFEVIVVDDGSTDKTPEALHRYTDRIILSRQPHQGLTAACNEGFARARGVYVARLDSDDFVDPAWLRREMELLDQSPQACCVFPRYVQVFANGTRTPMPIAENNLYSLLACGTMFRVDAVRLVGGFRAVYWEEYDLYLRLRDSGLFLHVPEPLYYYRQHSSSMTADPHARRAGWQQLIHVWGSQRLLAAGACPELLEAIAADARGR